MTTLELQTPRGFLKKNQPRFHCPLQLLTLLLVSNLWYVFVIEKCFLKLQLEQEETLRKLFIRKNNHQEKTEQQQQKKNQITTTTNNPPKFSQ